MASFSMSDLISLPVLSVLVALMAATVGPLAAVAVARLQLRWQQQQFKQQSDQFFQQLAVQSQQAKLQLISPMRQQWINALRDTVAETLSQASMLHLRGDPPTSAERQLLAAREAKLELLINPNEEDHETLLKAVRFAVNSIGSEPRQDFHNGRLKAVEVAQRVLKQEWEVTKRGET